MRKLRSRLLTILLVGTMLVGSIPVCAATTDNQAAATTATEAKVQSGWVKQGGKLYYYKNGAKVKGWQTLKSYYDKKTYKFYFDNNGQLVTDLFSLDYNKYIKKDIQIVVNTKTHNVTLYAKDAKTKKYNIPLKTMVCSTSRKPKGTKAFSSKCRLEKTSATRWFIYKKSRPYHYYQWGVKVKHGNFYFHSARYTTTNKKKLEVGLYNQMGTNQTTTSVRLQAVNAKLIYDIATKTNKKRRVWVKVIRKKTAKGPFGISTLKNTTGKIKNKKKRYDPTDPTIKSNKKIYTYALDALKSITK